MTRRPRGNHYGPVRNDAVILRCPRLIEGLNCSPLFDAIDAINRRGSGLFRSTPVKSGVVSCGLKAALRDHALTTGCLMIVRNLLGYLTSHEV